MTSNKHFTHDCDRCIPLGDYEGKWDLYYCPSKTLGGSLLCRFGEEAHEYASSPIEVMFYSQFGSDHCLGLVEGFRRVLKDHIQFDFQACFAPVRQLWEDVSSHPEIKTWMYFITHTEPEITKLLQQADTETDPTQQTQLLYKICHELRMFGEDIRYELTLRINDKEVTVQKKEVIPLEERI